MAEHTVQMSDSASLYVKLLGDTSASPSKPLLIAVHSAPGMSDHTETESAYGFLQHTFRVLVYDARGSGRSALKPPYTHERWTKDIDELRIWANADKFVLAGGSYGTFVALDYALAYGERLTGLILRGAWAWGARGMMQALKACVTSRRARVDAERQYRLWSGNLVSDRDFVSGIDEIVPLFGPPREGSVEDAVPEEPAKADGDGNAEGDAGLENVHSATQNFAFGHNMPRFDVRARLGEIAVPTLVIVGRYDVITPVEFSEEIAKGIPKAELVVFERSGHNPAQDETEAFEARVGKFCSSLAL